MWSSHPTYLIPELTHQIKHIHNHLYLLCVVVIPSPIPAVIQEGNEARLLEFPASRRDSISPIHHRIGVPPDICEPSRIE